MDSVKTSWKVDGINMEGPANLRHPPRKGESNREIKLFPAEIQNAKMAGVSERETGKRYCLCGSMRSLVCSDISWELFDQKSKEHAWTKDGYVICPVFLIECHH